MVHLFENRRRHKEIRCQLSCGIIAVDGNRSQQRFGKRAVIVPARYLHGRFNSIRNAPQVECVGKRCGSLTLRASRDHRFGGIRPEFNQDHFRFFFRAAGLACAFALISALPAGERGVRGSFSSTLSRRLLKLINLVISTGNGELNCIASPVIG